MIPNTTLLSRVKVFARSAHAGQVRKYTGESYFTHCENVAKIVASSGEATEQMIAAAYLHDVAEDVPLFQIINAAKSAGVDTNFVPNTGDSRETRLLAISHYFGVTIAHLVEQVTDVSKPTDGNRKARKHLDCEHLAKATPEAQTIKLADLIDNAKDIDRHDPKFAKVYMHEKAQVLSVLTKGNDDLWHQAHRIVTEFNDKLKEYEQFLKG